MRKPISLSSYRRKVMSDFNSKITSLENRSNITLMLIMKSLPGFISVSVDLVSVNQKEPDVNNIHKFLSP